jgi:hypothetical protein
MAKKKVDISPQEKLSAHKRIQTAEGWKRKQMKQRLGKAKK